MTTDVLRLSGNYVIQTNQHSEFAGVVLDTVGDTDAAPVPNTVLVTGDLIVKGNTVFGTVTNNNVVNTVIKDNIITLNEGETSGFVSNVKNNLAGIEIDRGASAASTLSAKLLYNDATAVAWTVKNAITEETNSYRGLWDFKVGSEFSAIRVNAILYDPGTGLGGIARDGRLVFFAGQTGMLNVGTNGGGVGDGYNPINDIQDFENSYASRVQDPNDIPNKYYVDRVAAISSSTAFAQEAKKLKVADSSIEINEDSITGSETNVTIKLNDIERLILTPMSISFADIAINSSTVRTITTDTNLILSVRGTGDIVLDGPVRYQSQGKDPDYIANSVIVYSTTTVGSGGSGLMYVNKIGLDVNRDEIAGTRKAIIFGLIL